MLSSLLNQLYGADDHNLLTWSSPMGHFPIGSGAGVRKARLPSHLHTAFILNDHQHHDNFVNEDHGIRVVSGAVSSSIFSSSSSSHAHKMHHMGKTVPTFFDFVDDHELETQEVGRTTEGKKCKCPGPDEIKGGDGQTEDGNSPAAKAIKSAQFLKKKKEIEADMVKWWNIYITICGHDVLQNVILF